MAKITNPNDIVEEIVADYRAALGDVLVSVIMYGSAVTHEYRPGSSDINLAIVVSDDSIAQIGKCADVQKKWGRRNVTAPFFMTRVYIERSLDTYPIEFLDMKNNYRVLEGEDVLGGLTIRREHLRLQCERELKGASIHLRKAYVQSGGNQRMLRELLDTSVRTLVPVFKAMLILAERSIPASKSEVISALEERYSLAASVISVAFQSAASKPGKNYFEIFDAYVRAVDRLSEAVDGMTNEGSV
ncbi:MAG: hypothetical protein GF418_15220 [Chitinivibrionales bacterium]|nr:hypothetical protein [Chitinivibrionales bacterium]MBD3396972.1 hypothetical protein [Chitinivibrionales bacterium]